MASMRKVWGFLIPWRLMQHLIQKQHTANTHNQEIYQGISRKGDNSANFGYRYCLYFGMILITWRGRQKVLQNTATSDQTHPRDRILHISFHENFRNHNVGWFSQWQQCLHLYNVIGSYFTFSMSEETDDYIITLNDVCQVPKYGTGYLSCTVPWWHAIGRTWTNFCEGEI